MYNSVDANIIFVDRTRPQSAHCISNRPISGQIVASQKFRGASVCLAPVSAHCCTSSVMPVLTRSLPPKRRTLDGKYSASLEYRNSICDVVVSGNAARFGGLMSARENSVMLIMPARIPVGKKIRFSPLLTPFQRHFLRPAMVQYYGANNLLAGTCNRH